MRRLGLLAFLVLVFGPVLALLPDLVGSLASGHADWLWLAVPLGRRGMLFLRSIGLAAGVAVAGMVIGTLAATVLWRWHKGIGAHARWLLLVFIAVPPYVHALAWTSAAQELSGLLVPLGFADVALGGWFGSFWAQVMALLPVAVGLALVGLTAVDPALTDAARISRSDGAALGRVVLPLAAPYVLAGGGLLFVLSITDYSVPSAFQLNVYAMEIFAQYSAENQPAQALLLSVPLIVVAGLVVMAAQSVLRKAVARPPSAARAWATPPQWPSLVKWMQYGAVAVLVGQIIVPLASLAHLVGSWPAFRASVAAARAEIAFTGELAVLVSLCSVPIAWAVADRLAQRAPTANWWWIAVVAPTAIPASLVGIGLIGIWNQPWALGMHGTAAMPVLASLARFTPIAAIIMFAQRRTLDPLLLDAARVFRGPGWA